MRNRPTRLFITLLWISLGCGLHSGCAVLAPPRLRVAWVNQIPEINGVVESAIWNEAKPLTLRARPTLARQMEQRRVQVRALYDGRMLALLVSWPDATETNTRRWWRWNEPAYRYELEELPVDQLTVLWPLPADGTGISTGTRPTLTGDDFDLLLPEVGRYDAWQWSAGWTNLSRVADDMVWRREPQAAGEATNPSPLPRYHTRDGKNLITWRLEPDDGRPGTINAPRPRTRARPREPGGMGQGASGSAADVQAWGQYTRAQVKRPKYWVVQEEQRTPGYWFETDPHLFTRGFWLVELSRPLVTADQVDDYPLRGRGPFEMALAITDQEFGQEIFVTPRIKLRLNKPPDRR